MYDWPTHHYIDELKRCGHDIHFFNPITILNQLGTASEYSQLLVDEVKLVLEKYSIDLFFTSASDSTLTPSATQEISRLGIPTVLMHCDDLSVPFIIKKIAGSFDLVWATSRDNLDLLKSYGGNVKMMPYAANPFVFKPVKIRKERYIGFIGSIYGARRVYLNKLAQNQIPLKVFGENQFHDNQNTRFNNPLTRAIKNIRKSLPHTYQQLLFISGRKIVVGALKRSFIESKKIKDDPKSIVSIDYFPGPSFSEMGKYYSRMAMSYGSIEYGSTYVLKKPLKCIHLREFEAPMCGAIHIVNRSPELQEYFEEDREMIFYSSFEELLDKAKYYLDPARETARYQIRKAARKRAKNEHSWTNRFEKIWQAVGLSHA
ncbi:MAG: glycosyltransferase [Parcubacteria group bacterium]|nr:glycosyltransferase [Parcubacteria group bacterium]